MVRDQQEGNPLAAGFFAAALLPPTDRQRQLTQKAKEASTKVRKVARTTAGAVKGKAKKATEQVRGTAANAANTAKGATKRPSGGRAACRSSLREATPLPAVTSV